MASSGTLAAGTTSYSSTIAAAGTAETVTFPDRYGYVTVTNLSTVALFVRTDGVAAADAADSYVVPPGDTRIFANGLPVWYQSSRVIPLGAHQFGGGRTSDSPSSPGTVTPMESLAGQMANPGTSISLFIVTGGTAGAYLVEAAG